MQLSENLKTARQRVGIGLVALLLSIGMPNPSDAYLFDPDGGGAATTVDAVNFDWAPTSFLAFGGVSAIGSFVNETCATVSCNFDVITHAKMTAANDSNNNNLLPGSGFTGEITLIARFTETVTSVLGAQAKFAIDTTKPLYLEIYFDTNATDSVPVSGYGFNNGRLILRATDLLSSSGDFEVDLVDGVPTIGALDQTANGNQYDGQDTVTGSGKQGNLDFGGLTVDSTFFKQALEAFGLNFSNVSQALPFEEVDPSDCFTQYAATNDASNGSGLVVGTSTAGATQCLNAHIDTLMSGNNSNLNGGYLPNIGNPNGGFPVGGVPGSDFLAQSDYVSSLRTAVPEPASMLLLGAGLIGMGGYARRRNRKSE